MSKFDYEEYQQHVTLLEGLEDIQPYFVKLPDPPPLHQFVNFGLPKEQQFFKREHIPTKVRNLDIKYNSGQITIEELIAACEKDEDVAAFIEDQWHKRHNGLFIIIYGKPTYITPQHWFYLNYHVMDTGKLADFRTTDRDYWYWRKFCVWDDPKVYGGINFTNRREGKCLLKWTLVRMYDGSVKFVQDIKDGDVVMGTDSEPRIVSGVTSGKEKMYWIKPKRGKPFGCNESHILSLYYNGNSGMKETGWKKKTYVTLSVKEYLALSDSAKNYLCLYKTGWGSNFKEQSHVITPYILGVYLGDGTASNGNITNPDEEIIAELNSFAQSLGLSVYTTKEMCHNLRNRQLKQGTNPYRVELKRLNVINNKHIPQCYLIDSEKNRLDLLAGLIDTDGHLMQRSRRGSGSGKCPISTYEITQKSKVLADGIMELAQSLGFGAFIREKMARMKREDGSVYECLVYRINISGDLTRIPCRVKRKIVTQQEKRNNPLHTGITVEEIGVDEYFGFAVDGNHLFLLADGTVVHNSLKASAELAEIATRRRNSMCGIQSKTDGDAKSFFRKFIVRQYRKYPFYFKPVSDGNKNPVTELKFEWGRAAGSSIIEPLETLIDFRSSVPIAYDGEKLIFYIMDEAGKFLNCSPADTWDKVKYCLQEQDRVIGKAIITTTVEEMEKGGGRAFKELWDESSRIPFHKRINQLGQTNSGLIPYFTPAYMGFIFDQYGSPIVKDPLPHQQKYRYKSLIAAKEKPEEAERISKMGSVELLAHMEKTKTTEKDRQDFRRKFPNSIKQAFTSAFKTCHFSYEKISNSLEKYLYTSRETIDGHPFRMVQGNFEWENSIRDGNVVFKPSNTGRWMISYLLPQSESNKFEHRNGLKVPANAMKGMAGIDPYGFTILSDTNNKPSRGAGYIWWNYDPSVDTDGKEEHEQVTDDFIVEYLNRPVSRDIFNEDMIMMAVYYGVKVFIETNRDHCINYFVERGYEGYLVFPRKVKKSHGKMVVVEAEKAGAYSAGNTKYKDGIFAHFEWYVENKIERCKFPRLIEDIRDVEYDNTQPYDAFMGAGYCLFAAKMVNKKPTQKKGGYSSPIATYQTTTM